MLMISSLVSGCNTSTRLRDNSGLITSKLGFSVVAPIRVIRPDSTWGKNASCCALLKRWISSTNSTVRICRFQFWRACSMTLSTSFLPLVTADSSTNSASTPCAMILARVVLPLPGGPHRIKLTGSLRLTICLRISPSPSKCVWPITSSSDEGRMRSARGTRSITIQYSDFYVKGIILVL